MANIVTYPLEDNYKTKLTQEWNWSSTWSIYVKETPWFTLPSWYSFYVTISPNTSRQQVVLVDWFNVSAKTLNISDSTVDKWPWLAYTASTHPVWSEVIISDPYITWKVMIDSINSKFDNDGWNGGTSFDLQINWSNFRIRKDWNNMKFTDDTQAEVSLSTLAAAAGADHKFLISVTDTTAWYLNSKLTAWDWISKTTVNPWGDESIDLDIDLSDTTIFSATQVSGKVPLLNGSGRVTALINWQSDWSATSWEKWLVEMATDAEVITGTDQTRYVNPKQARDNFWREIVAWTTTTLVSLPTTREPRSTSYQEFKRFTVWSVYKPWIYTTSYDYGLWSAGSGTSYFDLRLNWTSFDTLVLPINWTNQSGTRSVNVSLSAWDVVSLWSYRTNSTWWQPDLSNFLCRYTFRLIPQQTITATGNID